MGQRLVLTVVNGGKTAFTVFFKWSGYTEAAYAEAQSLIEAAENGGNQNQVLKMLRHLKKNRGAAMQAPRDLKVALERYPEAGFSENDPEKGIFIALTEESARELRKYSEGDLLIDLDDRTLRNEVFIPYESMEEYAYQNGREPDITLEPVYLNEDICFKEIPEAVEEARAGAVFVDGAGFVMEPIA